MKVKRSKKIQVTGTIPEIICNDKKLYEGDLRDYFKIIFTKGQNLSKPYHNFRHIFHVMWLCHDACKFYKNQLSKREMRNLLIAAMFHDFNHTGSTKNDQINIQNALKGLKKYISQKDKVFYKEIYDLIKETQFPHKTPSLELPLLAQILRDADVGQTLSTDWIQQIVFGLSVEMGTTPILILKKQEEFLRSLHFTSKWGRLKFDSVQIGKKIKETSDILKIIESK